MPTASETKNREKNKFLKKKKPSLVADCPPPPVAQSQTLARRPPIATPEVRQLPPPPAVVAPAHHCHRQLSSPPRSPSLLRDMAAAVGSGRGEGCYPGSMRWMAFTNRRRRGKGSWPPRDRGRRHRRRGRRRQICVGRQLYTCIQFLKISPRGGARIMSHRGHDSPFTNPVFRSSNFEIFLFTLNIHMRTQTHYAQLYTSNIHTNYQGIQSIIKFLLNATYL